MNVIDVLVNSRGFEEIAIVAAAALPESIAVLPLGWRSSMRFRKAGASVRTKNKARLATDCFIELRISLMSYAGLVGHSRI
jgi:hypothetical protein